MSFDPFPTDPNPYPTVVIERPGAQTLYHAATGFEKALADVDAERIINIHAELIIAQWDPYAISYQNLPYLAWAMGSELWEDIWSEGIKRDWVARQWTYKSIRGTPAGIKRALEPSGYHVTDMCRPPQGFYLSPEMTKEELDAWYHLMPELRVTYADRQGTRGEDEFFLDAAPVVPDDPDLPGEIAAQVGFLDQDAIMLNDGWELYGRLAIIRSHGVDTPIHTIEFTQFWDERTAVMYERFSTSGKGGPAFIIDDSVLDDPGYGGFICAEEVEPKLYTLRLDRAYSHDLSLLALTTLVPDLTPVTMRYERESDVGNGNSFLFLDDTWFTPTPDAFMDREDGGGRLLADRIFLLDPEVAEPMTEGISFLNEARLGLPQYLAEVQIDLHTFEFVQSVFLDECFLDEAFWVAEDFSHQERAFRAVNDAAAFRDTILVSFAPVRPLQMGDYMTTSTVYHQWIRAGL
jgi:phage tail P2-like protein